MDTFHANMKRKLKWISLNYVLPSYRILDILKIGVGTHNWMYVRKKDFHVSCTWYKSLICTIFAQNSYWQLSSYYFFLLESFENPENTCIFAKVVKCYCNLQAIHRMHTHRKWITKMGSTHMDYLPVRAWCATR